MVQISNQIRSQNNKQNNQFSLVTVEKKKI